VSQTISSGQVQAEIIGNVTINGLRPDTSLKNIQYASTSIGRFTVPANKFWIITNIFLFNQDGLTSTAWFTNGTGAGNTIMRSATTNAHENMNSPFKMNEGEVLSLLCGNVTSRFIVSYYEYNI